MKIAEFDYTLPEELIAQLPLQDRSASRLLVMGRRDGFLFDRQFTELSELLNPGDLLIFNDTKVLHARLFGEKESGGKVEVLVERIIDEQSVLAHVRASKSPKPGARLVLEGKLKCSMAARHGELFELVFDTDEAVIDVLEHTGRLPLPPYIQRDADEFDEARYQTLYADKLGAIAAPTAGLHFDEVSFGKLVARGIKTAKVTLHVGAGTFQPVRVDDIHKHTMHQEWFEVTQAVVDEINKTHEKGGRVIAVGTTVVRSLESAAQNGTLQAFSGETNIFIYPGYQFKVIEGMITNFHLPRSTLLMLVSAFAGKEHILSAYRHAIRQGYRFFSYGDAMLII